MGHIPGGQPGRAGAAARYGSGPALSGCCRGLPCPPSAGGHGSPRQQPAALQRITARGTDLVQLARDTRQFLRPAPGAPSSAGVSAVGDDVRAVFGMPTLTAAAITDPGVCRWCAAVVAAQMLGTVPPAYSPAFAELLGRPCGRHGGLLRAEMAELRVQVDAGAVRPSRARTAPSVPVRPATPQKTAVRPVQRPSGPSARPVPPAVLRAALASAGMPPRARYSGRRNCGHLVAEQCRCPRVASRPVTAAARPGPHPCGCACEQHQDPQ